MKLQDEKFYPDNYKDDEYTAAQISRHSVKAGKKRSEKEYIICSNKIHDLLRSDAKMICLGTRNNHERDIFARELNIRVFSQDIAEASGADIIGDFNKLSEITEHDWDIIYSNSIDHAVDSTNVFFEWLKVLRVGGIMVLGFSFDAEMSISDCNRFTKDNVDLFMKQGNEKFDLIDTFVAADYEYWVVRKK